MGKDKTTIDKFTNQF